MADSTESSITNSHEAFASQACLDFASCKYDSCKSILDQLSILREKDFKVEMNLALVDYYKTRCTNKKEFFVTICGIIKRLQMEDDLNIDNEYVIIYYNYAVMLFEMKQFNMISEILEKVLQNTENFDEEIINKMHLLLVDACIKLFQPFKALSLIDYVDKIGLSGATTTFTSTSKTDESNNKEGTIDCTSDPNKFIFVLLRTCCYLMMRSVKQSKREIKTIVNSTSLPFVVSYLKANIELLRGNYTKSLRLLSTILDENNYQNKMERNIIVNNNMAVIYFNQRRYNIAQIYLTRAITDNKANTFESNINSKSVKNVDILYNLGLSMLMSGHVEQAFEYLIKVVAIYKTNARLWLRIAECCIQLHQPKNDMDRNAQKQNQVIEESISSGIHHKFILSSNHTSKEKESSLIGPSLKFASLCLDNSIHCLNHLPQLKITSLAAVPSPDPMQSSLKYLISAPSTPMAADEIENVKCSVLTAKSYIHLQLNDPVVTLNCVTQLLAMPKLSGLHRYLASIYQAEALLKLDQLTDIVDILNVEAITDINLIESDRESTASLEIQEQADSSPINWFPRTLEQARSIMHHNLAVTYALRGENEKSRNQLNKAMNLLGKPFFIQMSSLRIYIDLIEGNALKDGSFIKENFGHLMSF